MKKLFDLALRILIQMIYYQYFKNNAISKYNRDNGKGMPTWCSKEEAYHNLIQEFTDVMIDLNQLARMMNWDEETFKPYKMKALDDINRRYDEARIGKNLKAFREGKFNTNAKG